MPRGRGSHEPARKVPHLPADEAFELGGRNVDRFSKRGGIVLGNNRRGPCHPSLQAANFVPIARFLTIEVPQPHLNSKEPIAETLQRSRNDSLNPSNQLFVAAHVVVAIDQDLHSSISSTSRTCPFPQVACRVAVPSTSLP
jgi:hypothetical protein